MISFGTKYWFIFLIVFLAIAAGIVILLYKNSKANKAFSKNQLRALAALRFLSFFLISFLLLSPFIRNLKKITHNPVIIAAWDNSSSLVSTKDSLGIANAMRTIKEELKAKLENNFEWVDYIFGENVTTDKPLDFTDKITNYSQLLTTINNNHFNQNVGALIVAGDGIYNEGRNPLNLLDEMNFPVYTIAFGDTTLQADGRIQKIRANRTAFSGNKFPVEVDLQFSKLQKHSSKLSISNKGKVLESVIITPPNDNYFHSHKFILEAGEAGLQHFSVLLEQVKNEQNTKNNSKDFVINVLKNKQKILILSDGWHPDIGAIRNTLDQQKTYDVSVFTQGPYPSNLDQFNLLILHQLPSSSMSVAEIIEAANVSRLPLLFVLGSHSFLPQLNALTQGVKIENLAGNGEQAQAWFNNSYATFGVSEELIEFIPKLPPLQVAYAEYTLNEEFTPLLYQKLQNIKTTKPLIATGKTNGRKVGYIFGEGIWRWRLFDYYQHQSHVRFNEIVNQLIQYLSLRENEDNLIVEYQPIYNETDKILLSAELYNDVFERVSGEEINIEIKNSQNEEFKFTFDVKGQNYILNAGHLPIDDYSFTAEVKVGNETYLEKGNFTIIEVNIEDVNVRANHNLLYQMAGKSGGEFFLPHQTQNLISNLESEQKPKANTYFQEIVNELINLKYLFFIALVLVSVEWFLRKFWGIY